MVNEGILRLLRRHPRRGFYLFRVFYIGFAVAAACAIFLVGYKPLRYAGCAWSGAFLVLGTTSLLAWYNARDRLTMSRMIAEDPTIVYWAHASGAAGPDLERPVDECTTLRLHLLIGRHLEVELPVRYMRELNALLREKNPNIRWGHYDPVHETRKTAEKPRQSNA